MDIHKDDEKVQLCGKLAIVKSILEAEQASYLHIDKEGADVSRSGKAKVHLVF